MKRWIALALLACFVMPSVLLAIEHLETSKGATVIGVIDQEEFFFELDSGGRVMVPRPAAKTFESTEDGFLEVTLKDGSTFRGTLETEISLKEGMLHKLFEPKDVKALEFDLYADLENYKSGLDACPIRMKFDIDPINAMAAKTRITKTRRLQCQGHIISALGLDLKKKRKKIELRLTPTVTLARGEDQWVSVRFELWQDGKILGTKSKSWPGDEGEYEIFESQLIEIERSAFDMESPATIKVQMVTTDRNDDNSRSKGTFFWWFTIPIH